MSFADAVQGLPKLSGMVAHVDIQLSTELALQIKRRRQALGITHDDVRAAGGPSSPTMTKIESGEGTISDASARRLEQALLMVRGSLRRLASGETLSDEDVDATVESHPLRGVSPDRVNGNQIIPILAMLQGDDTAQVLHGVIDGARLALREMDDDVRRILYVSMFASLQRLGAPMFKDLPDGWQYRPFLTSAALSGEGTLSTSGHHGVGGEPTDVATSRASAAHTFHESDDPEDELAEAAMEDRRRGEEQIPPAGTSEEPATER